MTYNEKVDVFSFGVLTCEVWFLPPWINLLCHFMSFLFKVHSQSPYLHVLEAPLSPPSFFVSDNWPSKGWSRLPPSIISKNFLILLSSIILVALVWLCLGKSCLLFTLKKALGVHKLIVWSSKWSVQIFSKFHNKFRYKGAENRRSYKLWIYWYNFNVLFAAFHGEINNWLLELKRKKDFAW